MERGIIHRSGRPSAIHEGDIGVHLPREVVPLQDLVDQPGKLNPGLKSLFSRALEEGSCKFSLSTLTYLSKSYPNFSIERFKTIRPMATLALLQGRIYNKLYSAKSLTKSKLERLRWVGILDEELQHWKDLLPIEIRPGHELRCHQNNILPILTMHLKYFDALSTVHRVSLPYSSWGREEFPIKAALGRDDLQINPRVFASAAIRVGAARSVIGLLKVANNLSAIERNVCR